MSTIRFFLVTALFAAGPLAGQTQGSIGIGPGDTVSVATGQGFVMAIVTERQEHLFRVRIINGPEVLKRYPAEVRRRGETTAYDRANGIYDNEDRIQVLYQGKWIDSRVIASMGMEYQVALPGTLAGWVKPEQMRFVSVAPPKAVAKAGQPPRPGLVSCPAKVEGRYAAEAGMAMQLTIRAGKATISMMGDKKVGDCWFGDGKVYLTMPGEDGTMELEVNDDGSLQAPFGELKKKAS
jgi:hypothetical protein